MSVVLVSDSSVLVDLHRGAVLDIALGLPYDFAVPDLLFDRELRTWDGPVLEGRLNVLALDAAGVELATGYRRIETRLSLPDAFALALAKTGGYTPRGVNGHHSSPALPLASHGSAAKAGELESKSVLRMARVLGRRNQRLLLAIREHRGLRR